MSKYKDTYFLDASIALKVALEQNIIDASPPYNSVQVCYYDAEKELENAPKNCIFVPFENVYNYFVRTENRLPVHFNFENSGFSEDEMNIFFNALKDVLNAVNLEKTNLEKLYQEECKNLIPNYSDEKLRIFITVSRKTTVLRYVAKAVSDEFKKKGFDVYFQIPSEMSAYYILPRYVKYYNFNPHITFNIDYENNDYINDKVINFIWYQDPMPQLKEDARLFIRKERDIIYTLTKQLMPNKISEDMYTIQKVCVDNNIFYRDISIKKENKIIFIGSCYQHTFQGIAEKEYLILYKKFRQMLYDNCKITKDIILELSKENNTNFNSILYGPLSVAVREVTVEWICIQKEIKVEVYGRFWENNKIVSPYFKGEIPFGEELNKIYNSAKYALSSHPSSMYLTRIAEMSSCETIPVIFDARALDTIEYEHANSSLIFSNYDELITCLSKEPKESVLKISSDMSYSNFVDKMIIKIKEEVSKNENVNTGK